MVFRKRNRKGMFSGDVRAAAASLVTSEEGRALAAGLAHADSGDQDSARQYLAIAERSEDPDILTLTAVAYDSSLGDHKAAYRLFQRAAARGSAQAREYLDFMDDVARQMRQAGLIGPDNTL